MYHIDLQHDYPKITETKSIIRFQDCDPLKHLNNAKYFDYFFNAREDQVAKMYKLKPSDFFNDYLANWVVYHHEIAYLRSAMVGEWVTICSSLIYYDQDTVMTEFYMLDDEKTMLKALLWTTSKLIDGKTGKKTTHPEPMLDYLKAIHLPTVDTKTVSFQDRIKQIKQGLAK